VPHRKEVIVMFWDFFDDDFWDLDLEDFPVIGGVWGLMEEEYEEDKRVRKRRDKNPDEDYPF